MEGRLALTLHTFDAIGLRLRTVAESVGLWNSHGSAVQCPFLRLAASTRPHCDPSRPSSQLSRWCSKIDV